jgi:hypothetical protein
MAFLLTWHGTLLCRHRESGALVHRPLSPLAGDAEPVALDLPIELMQPGFGHHLRATLPELPVNPPGALLQFSLRWAGDQRTVTLQHDGAFLSAEPEGDAVSLSRTEAGGWETFLPLSQADLDVLRTIVESAWLTRSSGTLAERPTLGPLFHIHVGDLSADLRFQLPFDLAGWPDRLTLLRDAWRIDQICQYRPLIYYSAFGSPEILQQFAISLRSLLEFGRYQGAIVVLTDQMPATLADFVPADDLARVALLQFQPSDRPGFMAARYLIMEWPDAWRFQPLLYVDTDTVFDRDVTPMLHVVATSDRIAAPIELRSTLSGNPASGAALLQRDFCSPGFMAGFNTGTLGIPNLRAHAETLRLIRRIIMNHAAVHGRSALPFVDQEIANYVSYRIAPFDTGLISRFVRFAGNDADIGNHCGLVHFWPVAGAAARAQAMRDYLARLRAATG